MGVAPAFPVALADDRAARLAGEALPVIFQ
jgi:hypothetical protein